MNSRREAQTTYPDRPKYYHTRILHQKLIGETVKHEHDLAYCISFTPNKAIQDKEQEKSLILQTNAIIDEDAVGVHLENTPFAH